MNRWLDDRDTMAGLPRAFHALMLLNSPRPSQKSDPSASTGIMTYWIFKAVPIPHADIGKGITYLQGAFLLSWG